MQIDAIQETHITQEREYAMGNYKIISSATRKATAGIVQGEVAITIHERATPNITQGTGQSRAIRVTMGQKLKYANT